MPEPLWASAATPLRSSLARHGPSGRHIATSLRGGSRSLTPWPFTHQQLWGGSTTSDRPAGDPLRTPAPELPRLRDVASAGSATGHGRCGRCPGGEGVGLTMRRFGRRTSIFPEGISARLTSSVGSVPDATRMLSGSSNVVVYYAGSGNSPSPPTPSHAPFVRNSATGVQPDP